MRIVLLVVVALALVPSVTAAPSETTLPSLEQALLEQINATRAEHGLARLSLSPALRSAAREHTRAMLERGFFDHRSPNGPSMVTRVRRHYTARGYTGWSVGENLLMTSYSISARAAIDLWLQSPGHRHNLLRPTFKQVGIGAAHRDAAPGVYGGGPALVITLDLGTRVPAS